MSDLKTKLKETADKAKQKLDDSKIQDKVGEALSKENKDMAIKKAKGLATLAEKYLTVKKVILGVAAISVLMLGKVLLVEPTPEPIIVKNMQTTYIYDENKIFGDAININHGGFVTFTPKSISFEGLAFKIKSILKTHIYTHYKTGTTFNDVAYELKIVNPIFGGTVDLVLQKAEFKVSGKNVKGYNLFILDKKAPIVSKTSPDSQIIYTNYADPKE